MLWCVPYRTHPCWSIFLVGDRGTGYCTFLGNCTSLWRNVPLFGELYPFFCQLYLFWPNCTSFWRTVPLFGQLYLFWRTVLYLFFWLTGLLNHGKEVVLVILISMSRNVRTVRIKVQHKKCLCDFETEWYRMLYSVCWMFFWVVGWLGTWSTGI